MSWVVGIAWSLRPGFIQWGRCFRVLLTLPFPLFSGAFGDFSQFQGCGSQLLITMALFLMKGSCFLLVLHHCFCFWMGFDGFYDYEDIGYGLWWAWLEFFLLGGVVCFFF